MSFEPMRTDRKCFVITAAPRRRQNSGTRCVSGVPPARQNVSSGAARHPGACYSFATVLLSICYHRGLPVCRLLPFCYSFAIELLPLPFCVPSPRHVSDVYIAEPQGCPFRIPVIAARCPSALNRPLYPGYAMPDGLSNASRAHSKLLPRSPLSMGFSEPFDQFAGF